jgi:(S)-sulfolactate dehydrogenase
MPDIVITEFMDDRAVAGLARDFDVHYNPDLVDDPDELAGLLADARALIVRNRTQVRAPLLRAAPKLIVVARLGVGLDNIDVEACAEQNIAVKTAGAANANAVAEYVLAACFSLLRPAVLASARVAAGHWPRQELVGFELAGRRLGLVGLGSIARILAAKTAALGMSVAAHDPLVPPGDPAWQLADRMEFRPLLASCDVVSLHVPLIDSTRHLIDTDAVAALPDHAILVNTSRGGIVDEEAVVTALRAGTLGGAALDVFESEPVDAESGHRYGGVPNLILTPHIAGLTEESQRRVGEVTAANVRAALAGAP